MHGMWDVGICVTCNLAMCVSGLGMRRACGVSGKRLNIANTLAAVGATPAPVPDPTPAPLVKKDMIVRVSQWLVLSSFPK
jgi:hypothetical protein